MTNKKTINAIEEILANTYSLYLKTQNYHWNVTGPNFKTYHELFGLQYEEFIPAIDELAERIRTLGPKVDGSYANFGKLTKFAESKLDINASEMVKDLIESNNILIEMMKKGVVTAQDENDEASADILIGRIEAHEKHVWMLQSSL